MSASKFLPFPYQKPIETATGVRPRLLRVDREGPVLVVLQPSSAKSFALRNDHPGWLQRLGRRVRRAFRRLQSRMMRGTAKPELIVRSGP